MARTYPTIGWREVAGLPDLGIDCIAAKIDTGARTSSLHAVDMDLFERGGEKWARFFIDLGNDHRSLVCEAPRVAHRTITSSNGQAEERLIIKTAIRLGAEIFRAEFSLADRSDMLFPVLVGRTALRKRFLVDSGRSYLQSTDEQRQRMLK